MCGKDGLCGLCNLFDDCNGILIIVIAILILCCFCN